MNPKILDNEIQEYIRTISDTNFDINKIILAGSSFEGVTIQEIAQQIVGRQKAITKLPTWAITKGIYYPPKLNLEQTSSETTAIYKSNIVQGNTLIDLTGGFGIDDYFFSKKVDSIIHCELNNELSKIALHNFKALGAADITTYAGNGLERLASLNSVDWIYIDPSRRHDKKGKVFFLEDCEPNVPKNLDFMFTKTSNILIKTSPLLDIQHGINALQNVKDIHIVAVNNEVKELLWILEKDYIGQITMYTANIRDKDQQFFSFLLNEETTLISKYSSPKKYVYEPNSAIMKSGGFASIGFHFDLEKLHQHSHLYTSDQIINFPGRCFEVMDCLPYNKKAIGKLRINQANITTRNFSETVAMIRKKFKIKDGGDDYIFFTTDSQQNKIVVVCKKVS